MKRHHIICILLLLFSFVFVNTKTSSVLADTTFSVSTYTPHQTENSAITDYANLNGITYFTIMDNLIYYTLDGTSIKIYNTTTKTITDLNHTFTNIDYMDNAFGYLFVSDNKALSVFYNNTISSLPTSLDGCEISGYTSISTYTKNNNLYVSYVKNNNLHFHRFSLNTDTNLLESQNCVDYLSSNYDNIFDSVTMITLSDSKIFIISNGRFYTITLDAYFDISYTYDNGFSSLGVSKITYISFDYKDYLIVSHQYDVEVYDIENTEVLPSYIDGSDNGLTPYTTGVVRTPQYVDVKNNKVYISDNFNTSVNIQAFTIDNNGFTLDENDNIVATTILASLSADEGRFYNALDILSKDDSTIYVADTDNNRIQILNSVSTTTIDSFSSYMYAKPHSLMLDEYNNLYYTVNTSATHSSIVKYNGTTSVSILDNVGIITDTTITYNNVIFALSVNSGSGTSSLLKIENGATSSINDSLNLSENAKIEYITALNVLVIYNNDTFTIVDTLGEVKNTQSIIGVTDFTTDYLGNLYIMTSSTLYTIKVGSDYTFSTLNNISFNYDFSNYSTVALNNNTNTLYLFNTSRQCIEYFTSNEILGINIVAPVDAFNNTAILNITSLTPAQITTTSLIHEYPYNLGNTYNLDYSIQNVFIIGTYESYYYILFNNNNTLCDGYIKTDRVTTKNITSIPKDVITTNDNVTIYKYPTILRYNNEVFSIGKLERNVKIRTKTTFPISIDGKTFYIYENNGTVGFIYSADVVIGTAHIEYLPTTNAKINIIDKTDYVNVYKSNSSDSEILDTLLNEKRISVADFDKDKEYTYITYVDENQVTRHGYIKTENIKLDGIDSNTITLVLIICITIVLFVVLIITFVSIKKKRRL